MSAVTARPVRAGGGAPDLKTGRPAPAALRPEVSRGAAMTVVLDATNRPRHPEKAQRPDAAALKKPDWIRVRAPISRGYGETQAIVRPNRLHTVCEEAGCPNIGECWNKRHATFMIMGDTCTRACAFCNVKTGLPGPLDAREPPRGAHAPPPVGGGARAGRRPHRNARPQARGGDLG